MYWWLVKDLFYQLILIDSIVTSYVYSIHPIWFEIRNFFFWQKPEWYCCCCCWWCVFVKWYKVIRLSTKCTVLTSLGSGLYSFFSGWIFFGNFCFFFLPSNKCVSDEKFDEQNDQCHRIYLAAILYTVSFNNWFCSDNGSFSIKYLIFDLMAKIWWIGYCHFHHYIHTSNIYCYSKLIIFGYHYHSPKIAQNMVVVFFCFVFVVFLTNTSLYVMWFGHQFFHLHFKPNFSLYIFYFLVCIFSSFYDLAVNLIFFLGQHFISFT